MKALTLVEQGDRLRETLTEQARWFRGQLTALGFADLRVRHYDDLARIEVPVGDLAAVLDRRPEVVALVLAAGYRTGDIMSDGAIKVGTEGMGDAILAELDKAA